MYVQASNLNNIAVTNNPFVWQPDVSGHYCLISRVSTPKHDNPIPAVGSYQDLTTFILANPGFGQRNISFTSVDSPSWSTPVGYAQGTEAGRIVFSLVCTNVPGGAMVAFSAGTPGPSPLIVVEQTTVPANHGSWGTFVICDVPANYQTTITYSYWANGTPPGWDSRSRSRPRTTSTRAAGSTTDSIPRSGWALRRSSRA